MDSAQASHNKLRIANAPYALAVIATTAALCIWTYLQGAPETIDVERAIYTSAAACELDWPPAECTPTSEGSTAQAASSSSTPSGPIALAPATTQTEQISPEEWQSPYFSSNGKVFLPAIDSTQKPPAITTTHASRIASTKLQLQNQRPNFDFRDMPAGNRYQGPEHYSLKRNATAPN